VTDEQFTEIVRFTSECSALGASVTLRATLRDGEVAAIDRRNRTVFVSPADYADLVSRGRELDTLLGH
jgi:hypothetical protein